MECCSSSTAMSAVEWGFSAPVSTSSARPDSSRTTRPCSARWEGLSGVGQASQGLTVVDEALARSERDEELWCIAELSRIKGEIVLQTGAPKAAATAERLFRQSIHVARRQGALSWELLAAMSLAT